MRLPPLLLVLAAAAALPAPARAQRLSGSAMGYNVQHRVLFADSVLEQTGFWFGLEGAVQLGRIRIGVSGLFGTLSGDSSATNPDRDVRVTTITAHTLVAPWAAVGLELEAKRFETDLGVTVWRLIGLNARLTPPLGGAGLRGVAELSYFASASVLDGPTMGPAMRGVFGVAYEAPRGPLVLRLAYRFERFDMKADGAATERAEQLRGVTAGVGLRLGRGRR